jgi:hypothetical protein
LPGKRVEPAIRIIVKTLTFLSILALIAGSAGAPFAMGEVKENGAAAAQPLSQDQIDFFEKKIRPVLSEKCYKCHAENSEKIKGGLTLDTREGIRRGGDNGPAIVPGSLKDSLLIDAIHYTNKDFSMPPQKSGGKLSDAVIQDFEKWVQMGAPDPRNGAAKLVKKYDTEKAKSWWSFQPPVKAPVPTVQDAAWPKTDSDRYLLAALEAKGLKPVADADKLTLIRRVYFDLVGLPPTLPDIEAFVKDTSPAAFARVVDRLLASQQFGEGWGRHWLDVARYAESSGKEANFSYPHAWRYRDYVIAAFNEDKPYDQFLREQLAGDLLPARTENERAEHKIATGYLAIGAKSQNEQNPRQFALDVADEQIDAISEGMLGITIACARCHDHKFDPIPQRDYYSLVGIFLSTDTRYGTAAGLQNRRPTPLIELPASSGLPTISKILYPQERERLEMEVAEMTRERDTLLAERLAARRSGAADNATGVQKGIKVLGLITRVGMMEAELNSFDPSGRPKILAMGVQDRPAPSLSQNEDTSNSGAMKQGGKGAFARVYGGAPAFPYITDSPLYARGEVDKPGEKVPRGFLTMFASSEPTAIRPGTSGRLELAQWLTSPANPLPARVMTNRIWHWLFGKGIVESVDNLGSTGQKPSNQALLDYLALRFQQEGYSVKRMVRELVLSHAYQLSSVFDEKSFAADPENALVWRMSKRRLDAECIRDAMLAVSGDLQTQAPVGSAIAMAGDGMINGPRGRGISEENISGETAVRSVYLPVARDLLPDSLALFDFAEPSLVSGERETTNVPSQALYMLNSPFVGNRAARLGERVMVGYPAGPNAGLAAFLPERITYAYWLAFSRPPDMVERTAAMNFFNRFPAGWKMGSGGVAGVRDAEATKAAWTNFCRALFASAEFRYLN